MEGTQLEDVNTFKYLGSTLKYDGSSKNELRIRLEIAVNSHFSDGQTRYDMAQQV